MIIQLHSANIYQNLFYIPHNYDYMKAQGSTVVGDYINKMKTTFDINFDLYHVVKHAWLHINIEVKSSCQSL